MTRDDAKRYVKQEEPTFLIEAKMRVNGAPTYICPSCSNGNGRSGDGICIDKTNKGNGKRWKCFKCGLSEDIIGLWKIHTGISNDAEAFKGIYDYYGYIMDGTSSQPQGYRRNDVISSKDEEEEPEKVTSYKDFYQDAVKHINETNYHRGLSEEILSRFGVGYVANWRHPAHPNAPTSPRLIIPITEYSYLARDTRPDKEIPEASKDFVKQKVKGKELVSWIFNSKSMSRASRPIFVVEGEIDAMSVIELGGEAVAIGSTANVRNFFSALKDYTPSQPFIVSLDDDAAGDSASEKLMEGLKERGLTAIYYNVSKGFNDANELLIKDRDKLKANIAKGEAIAAEVANESTEQKLQEMEDEKNEYLQTSASHHLQNFLNGISGSASTAYIPTGFERLDSVLDGGLYEGLYTVGAISSLGKTTLVLQIADNIASAGHDVLIFSMEMSEAELMGKSISRLTFVDVQENGGRLEDAKTYRGITTGSRYASYSQTEVDLIERAARRYGEYAGNIYVTEGIGDVGVAQIRQTIEKHIRVTGNKPVVFLDYLQILAPYNERNSDKQNTDKAILELKRTSRDLKLPIMVVSALNRMNYDGEITMSAFKESGAIEYGSDVLIGLQLKGCGSKDFDVNEAKKRNPREIELVILKNRNGETGDKVSYEYYKHFNYFEEV